VSFELSPSAAVVLGLDQQLVVELASDQISIDSVRLGLLFIFRSSRNQPVLTGFDEHEPGGSRT
jgi:hypothetical protein